MTNKKRNVNNKGNKKINNTSSTTNKKIDKEIKEKVFAKEAKNIEEPERNIKLKNYVILISIFLATFLVVIILRNQYIQYRDYQLTIPVLKDKLNEVTVAELDTYLIENTDAIIYIEVSEDENSRKVASDLYEVVKRRDLTERVVYLNISSVEDKEEFFNNFNEKYCDEGKKLSNYPALVLFYEGKVESYVSRTENQELNIGNVEQLFDQYELEG